MQPGSGNDAGAVVTDIAAVYNDGGCSAHHHPCERAMLHGQPLQPDVVHLAFLCGGKTDTSPGRSTHVGAFSAVVVGIRMRLCAGGAFHDKVAERDIMDDVVSIYYGIATQPRVQEKDGGLTHAAEGDITGDLQRRMKDMNAFGQNDAPF